MAESAISYVVQRLSDLLIQKADFLKGVRGRVECLRDELQRMQCFLKDADAKQEEDKRVHNWVSEIRRAAYDAEDLIDSFILEVESRKKHGFMKRCASILNELADIRRIGNEIEAFQARMNGISSSCQTYGIKNIGEGTRSTSRERLQQLRRSSPRGVDRDIVGMNRDTAQLVSQLLKKENRLKVISIVGMGGIGKTTLAKKVFNNSVVRGHFNCQSWVYVSQEYRPKDILCAIIREVIRPTKEVLEMMDKSPEEELEKMLYEHLEGKRYLVVLDDIWTTEAWDVLKKAFPDTSNGSKVLLTTRNRDVAMHADAQSAPYELGLLSEEESWELFSRKVIFDDIDSVFPPEFKDVGRMIVEKCDGLPLAIIVIAGLLSRKKLVSEWQRVLSNMDTYFAKGQNGVFAILALSYSDLPHYLKSCFLHLGLFPEDYVISARKLLQLWIAEGFIPQQEERMEAIAEDYLNELIDRNMVQVVRTSASKRVKQCRIHDVLRDLSIFKAKEEIFLEIHGKADFNPSVKSRLHAVHSNLERYLNSKPSTPHLRTLLFFHPGNLPCSVHFSQRDMIYTSFKLLRVLDLENMWVRYLSNGIGKLINLRFLGLRNTGLSKLPSSMKYLQSLQTLDISGDVSLQQIPKIMRKMESLRHLYMNPCAGHLPIENLRNLQTLSSIHIDSWKANNLGNLINLRKLGISLNSNSDVAKFFDSIAKLDQLVSLQLVSIDADRHLPSLPGLSGLCFLTKLSMEGRIRLVLGPHEFPPNLTHLTLQKTFLSQCPMGIFSELPKLIFLRLRTNSYTGDRMKIYAGGFPLLKFLELEGLQDLETLTIEKDAMPRLRHFRLSSCRELEELPMGIKFMNTLQELEISGMPSNFVNRLRGKDSYKIKHIPSITFS